MFSGSVQRRQCSAVFSRMAEEGDADQFPPFTPEQLQWIDRLIAARTDPGRDSTGGGDSGGDTSTSVPSSVPSSVPVPLVTPAAGNLVATVTPADTLVTPASRGGEWHT